MNLQHSSEMLGGATSWTLLFSISPIHDALQCISPSMSSCLHCYQNDYLRMKNLWQLILNHHQKRNLLFLFPHKNLEFLLLYCHPYFSYLLTTTEAEKNSYREHWREKIGKKESQIQIVLEKLVYLRRHWIKKNPKFSSLLLELKLGFTFP